MTEHINIISLGCSKNLVDAELLMGHLAENDYKVTADSTNLNADILIVNTCGFIGDAKEESINTILNCIEAKKQGMARYVFVMGCMIEKYRKEMMSELPEVDGFFGKFQIKEIVERLGKDYKYGFYLRILNTPTHYAYLKISEGCDRKCAFCAIPSMTGKHKSRPIEDLIEEAKLLAKQGVKELLLIAQDLSSYGLDIYGEQRLAMLLEELVKIKGIHWIKLHYAYPTNFPYDILPIMAREKKICNYLDIALQHSSDAILKNMRRGVTRETTENLINRIRKEVKGIAIRTTLLVGHPGETEEDFSDLIDFVKKMRFERLGAFTYSHEEGTYAYDNYKDIIHSSVKEERLDKLMQIQQHIAEELMDSMQGKVEEVIVDREEDDYFVGRTAYDSPEVDTEVYIAKDKRIKVGEFYRVHITHHEIFDLFAEIYDNKK